MTDARADAWTDAGAAADRIGVEVVELSTAGELAECSALLQRVWRAGHPAEIASASMLRTYVHSGNYVSGAYRGAALIGASVGFFGRDGERWHLHSHLAGVERAGHGKGVGHALKLHQRAWTLARGISEVHWTYDPLILRNAYFNLRKLGAEAVEYLPEFYGAMTDGINSGELTDRILVVWHLDRPHPAAADRPGAVPLVSRGPDGRPQVHEVPDSAGVLAVAVPEDAEHLRAVDRDAALAWRVAVRDALMGRISAGHRITGMTRDGHYLLERAQ
ncbi:GNAT family N-acetyltransferase [Dactylosporangium sp. CS-047395]|uniref:GNAT family N-acetyltransferase n=1 Tax=Dactylosporangium sp. CS-047395 TaxID=3239936 RepID=UPI003D935E06